MSTTEELQKIAVNHSHAPVNYMTFDRPPCWRRELQYLATPALWAVASGSAVGVLIGALSVIAKHWPMIRAILTSDLFRK